MKFINLLIVLAVASGPIASAAEDYRTNFKRPNSVPVPADNPLTPERVALGKILFFDPRLSGTEAISCATCHNPSFHWSDHLKVGRGTQHKDLARRSPTILNAAFNDVLMWDGRFASLEEQATGPMMSTAEMNIQPDEVVVKLRALPQYQSLFHAAFSEKGITTETIVKAIAAYERTIISADAPFDRYVKGDDNAISPEARRGFVLFNTKAHCATCHSGWNLSDSSFHDIGVASDDLGRGPIIGLETLNHAFKTPTLRNIQDRAPYTHNGSEKTLRDVVDLYDQGGRVKRATLSAEIKPLNLTEPEKNDLIAFLGTLTSQDAPVTLPVLP